MIMELTVLGSGTCLPSLTRNAPGYFLRCRETNILVDCGSGVLRQMLRGQCPWEKIDLVALTHFHPDHCSDLAAILLALKFSSRAGSGHRLVICGPAGKLGCFYRSCVASLIGDMPFPLRLVEMNKTIDFDGIHIGCCATEHLPDGESIAFSFSSAEGKAVFTGDADYSEALCELAEGADLLVADCSSLEIDKVDGHMSARQCGVLARKAGVKSLVLSHLHPANYPDQRRVEECATEYSGSIQLAEDLQHYRL